MKKIIILLSLLAFACSKPITKRDKAMQAVVAYLKITDASKIQFGKLDSVIDYPNPILRQIVEVRRQMLLAKGDSLKLLKTHDSLYATPKLKYYVINYLNKSENPSANQWQMLVMDSTFKIKTDTVFNKL